MNCTVNSHIPAGSAVLSMRARKTWAPRRLLTGCADVSASCCSACSVYTECSTSSEPTTVHHPTWWSSNQSSKSGTARHHTSGTVVLVVLQRSNALFVGDRSNVLFVGDRSNFVTFFCIFKKSGSARSTTTDGPRCPCTASSHASSAARAALCWWRFAVALSLSSRVCQEGRCSVIDHRINACQMRYGDHLESRLGVLLPLPRPGALGQ